MVTLLLSLYIAKVYGKAVAGVAPFDQHLYKPGPDNTFACLSDPSIKIPYSQVNDDYCDCPDGSDEPGTAACSNGHFWCAGSEQYIPSRVVGDGVCDYELCCDGSDEAPGLCENRCAEIKAKQAARRKAHEDFLREGMNLRKQMVENAVARKEELASSVESLGNRIAEIEADLQDQEAALKKAEEDDSMTDADPESLEAVMYLRAGLREANDHMDSLKQEIKELRNAYEVLEQALAQMSAEYNPNFNDPAVKEAIKVWKEHAHPVSRSQAFNARDLTKDIDVLESIKIAGSGDSSTQSDSLSSVLSRLLPSAVSELLFRRSAPSGKGFNVQKIQERIDGLNADLAELRKTQKLNAKLLELDSSFWGPDEIGRSAENLCVSTKKGDFTYDVCLYGTAVQSDGINNVQLGRSTGLRPDNSIEFVGGDRCPNNVERSLTLYLECGHDTTASSVEEPETCHYVVKAKSPIACSEITESTTIVHDEL